jgi:CheY-like chemotaxis protein
MEAVSRPGPRDLEVLVVEDDPDVRAALVGLVTTFGVRVRGAGDEETAFRLVLSQRPDLILCDLEMPNRVGHGFVMRLRGDPRFRRLLTIGMGGMSERVGTVDVAATRRAGFDGHVPVPVTARALARLLDRALDARATGDQFQGA